jgi:hypothetical protein
MNFLKPVIIPIARIYQLRGIEELIFDLENKKQTNSRHYCIHLLLYLLDYCFSWRYTKMAKLTGRKIFLLDAVGAVVSILILFLLYYFVDFFGMPKCTIKIFICIATGLFVYSTTMYFIRPTNWQLFLKIAASLNIGYCLFTIYQIFQNINNLTLIGHIYFTSEVLVILTLSIYELNSARKTKEH